MLDLGTAMEDPSRLPFHGLHESTEPPSIRWLFITSPGSHHCGTPRVYRFKQGDDPVRPIVKRQEPRLRCRKRTSMVQEYKPVSLSAHTY